jgi:hypothetical protein
MNNLIKGGLFPIYLSLFHIAFIVLMGIFGSYHFHSGSEEVPGLYASKFKENYLSETNNFIKYFL